MNRMKHCTCGTYTLKEVCPACEKTTSTPVPPRYSPEDRYGAYRRKAIEEEYGENGKYRKV
ncbi:MAG TPA: nucleolar RNA-binding Nop10p family protein [Candidatus Methanomethylophilaceae archaeon]|nr:nucleolar RNA-binding Nop10p family protein [Candidatus Methanomethylophilaceae archaeon]